MTIIEKVSHRIGAGRSYLVEFRPRWGVEYFDLPLSFDEFQIEQQEDYGSLWREVRCPCGNGLDYDGTVGNAVHVSRAHARDAHGIVI